jgi:hypothetical protein
MKHTALSMFIIIICALFTFCKTTEQGEPVTEDNLIGYWETIKGDVEEIAFSVEQGEKIYSSYLNSRLFETGTWELTGNSLIIDLDTGERITYVEVNIAGNILTLRTASGEESQYKKLTP